MTTFVYRGVLQRSRLRLIINALSDGTADRFIWLNTKPDDPSSEHRLQTLITELDHKPQVVVLNGGWTNAIGLRRELRALLSTSDDRLAAVGQSVLPLLPRRTQPFILFVNGIPEERLLYKSNVLQRIRVVALWAIYRFSMANPSRNLLVTVSNPMADYISRRLRISRRIAVPTAAQHEYFETSLPPYAARTFDFCYQGSGAPWQGLERLNLVWKAIVQLRPTSSFLIVSTDRRVSKLSEGLEDVCISHQSATSAGEMAALLADARVGWILREDNLVNRVSFPTKIGESLASGQLLVMSQLNWDPCSVVASSALQISALVGTEASEQAIAETAVALLHSSERLTPEAVRHAATPLGSAALSKRLKVAVSDWESN